MVAYSAEGPVSRATPSGRIRSWSSSARWPGGLFGILGIVFVTLALTVLRVLYDFFRVRLKTDEHASTKVRRRFIHKVQLRAAMARVADGVFSTRSAEFWGEATTA